MTNATFNVIKRDVLPQHHLVEWHGEAAVNVVSVEHCHADDATHKVEVGEVVGVDARVRVDLKGVDVISGVLKY